MIEPAHLAEGVYFCISQDHGIFLDLKRDTYSAIPVTGIGEGASVADARAAVAEAFDRHSDMLLSEGLITTSHHDGSTIDAFWRIERPQLNLFHPDDARAFGLGGEKGAAISISWIDVIEVFSASWRASRRLRRRHIAEVVETVRAWKVNRATGSLEDYRREVAIYRRLRPWYPRAYLCLWDALALIEFLARRGLFPDWIFGVQAQPFGAHCWLQANGMLLNENAEYTGQFTPIMCV